MDKTNISTSRTLQRKGFALIITLSVLSVVIALTMVLLSYFDEVKEDADTTKALIQADVYYSDIVRLFNRFKDKKELFKQLYRSSLPLQSDNGRFSMSLKCEPIAHGININWLSKENSTTEYMQYQEANRLFETLAQEYSLEDIDRLREMLLEEISINKKYISKAQSRLRQKKGIISYQQFSEILSRYQLEVDDLKVGTIPWKKYFSFSRKAQKIDAEYSTPELISFLFDIDVASVREWYSTYPKSSLQDFVLNNGADYNSKKSLLVGDGFLGESMCNVTYNVDGDRYRFTFDYIEGEAKYFEFYGKH